ncbi:hypothetical protein N7527_001174 [Penicillium freii]|nr:hypothetical protein N7527_001174 [Penicillium freii]
MWDDSESPDVKCFEQLPDDTYEAIGTEASAIRKIIRQQKNLPINVIKYLRFTNVPPLIAEQFSSSSTRHMFNYDTRSMIIKLVSGPHQIASRSLLCEVRDVLHDMGLHRSINPLGSTRIRGVSSLKEADESDAEWWLTNSTGEVKLVIIVSINRETPDIKFETVLLDTVASSLRRQRPRYVPTIRQSIITSRRDAQISTSPAVALTIKFEELFCRQPVPPEHNIELLPAQLEAISSAVSGEQCL